MFLFVLSSLGLDMGDSVDTSLGCGFKDLCFVVLLLKTLLALVVTRLFMVTCICGALRNPNEAMPREILGTTNLTPRWNYQSFLTNERIWKTMIMVTSANMP